jgi:hypothetical protein
MLAEATMRLKACPEIPRRLSGAEVIWKVSLPPFPKLGEETLAIHLEAEHPEFGLVSGEAIMVRRGAFVSVITYTASDPKLGNPDELLGIVRRASEKLDDQVLVPAARPGGAGVLLVDDFENPAVGKLAREPSRSDPGRYERGYVDGEYVLKKVDPTLSTHPIGRLPGVYANTIVSVEARVIGEPEDRRVLLGCRAQGDGTRYELEVDPKYGEFTLARHDAKKRKTLAEWQPSHTIQRGNATNHLELRCVGSTISAAINHVQVAVVEDGTYADGTLQFGVSADDSEPLAAEARFDNLIVVEP